MDVISVLLDVGIKSPFQRRKPKNTILLKKQVKFTDELKSTPDILTDTSEKDASNYVDDNPLQGWLASEPVNEYLIENSILTKT